MPVVTVRCPECSQAYSVDDSHVGRKGRCKGCGRSFELTSSGEVAGSGSGLGFGSLSDAPPGAWSQPAVLPEKIGRFLVKKRLGSGAFGTVYRANDPTLDRDVALKVPHPDFQRDERAVSRFLREARAAARLHHPHIVTVFEAGSDADTSYIASAFIPGRSLAEAIDDGPFESRRVARIVGALADALYHAHQQGIVHRDVKPANVLLDADDRPHLTDFGLARLAAARVKLTKVNSILGTPAYLSPEQAAGKSDEAQPASDQYSLGVVLFELLTGRTPFAGPLEVMIFHTLNTPPPSPRSVDPAIPAELDATCLRALAKRPEDRYASCRELAKDLGGWLAGRPSLAEVRSKSVATASEKAAIPTTIDSAPRGSSSLQTTLEGTSRRGASPPSPAGGPTQAGWRFRRFRRWMIAAAPVSLLLVVGLIYYTIHHRKVDLSDPLGAPPPAAIESPTLSSTDTTRPGGAPARDRKSTIPSPASATDLVTNLRSDRKTDNRQKFRGPTPLACWTFESNTRDTIGTLHGVLVAGGRVRDGRLYLEADGSHMITGRLSRDLREKTLEAWIMLPTLDQERGAGVMSIESGVDGSLFDAIVMGELQIGMWTAGSEGLHRSRDVGAAPESFGPADLIHLAITYDSEGGITVYRQGQPYGSRYIPEGDRSGLQIFPAGKARVLLGIQPSMRGHLKGAIEEARVYDRALTAAEVAASFRAGVIRSSLETIAKKGIPGPRAKATGTASALGPMPSGETKPSTRTRDVADTKAIEGTLPGAQGARTGTVLRSFFNGKDLSGWTEYKGFWKVDAYGRLSGSHPTGQKMPAVLFSNRPFSDFELTFRANVSGNCGVHIRSSMNGRTLRVDGPRCVIQEPSQSYPPGSVVTPPPGLTIKADQERVGMFNKRGSPIRGNFVENEFAIRCVDKRVTVRVNGITTVDSDFPLHAEGVIAWTIHSTRGRPSSTFSNISLIDLSARPLDPDFEPLSNGEDLAGWSTDGAPVDTWRAELGEIVFRNTRDPLNPALILSDRGLSDFTLRFDFRLSDNADGGVVILAAPGEKAVGPATSPEIRRFGKRKRGEETGRLRWSTSDRPEDALPLDRASNLRPFGASNAMEIDLRKGSLRISINGREVLKTDLRERAGMAGARPGLTRGTGRIGFLARSGTIRLRNIRIKGIKGPAAIGDADNKE